MTMETDVERVERAARNEALFRAVNERLEDLAVTFQEIAGMGVFACECANLACVEQIEMTLDEYEAIRSDPNQFIVLPRHVDPDVETVTQERNGFVVVSKIGEGAKVAIEQDPRS